MLFNEVIGTLFKIHKKCVCPGGYEFKTTTTREKKVILPNDGNMTGVGLWQLLLGLSAVVIRGLEKYN